MTTDPINPSEALAHMTPAQLDFIRLRAAEDLHQGRPATLRFRNGVELISVLQSFRHDQHDDVEGCMSLDLQHVGTKAEVARSIAGRLGLHFDAQTPNLDEAIEMARAAMEQRMSR
jgi:hypothetical protein